MVPKRTLVARDAAGGLIRIGGCLERAAFEAIEPTEQERTNLTPIFEKRIQEIKAAMSVAPQLVGRIVCVNQEGMESDRRVAVRELDKLAPVLRDRDTFRTQLQRALGNTRGPEFRGVWSEYSRAAISQAQKDAQAAGTKGNALIMSGNESLRYAALEVEDIFGQEAGKVLKTTRDVTGVCDPKTFGFEKVLTKSQELDGAHPTGLSAEEMQGFLWFALTTLPPSQRVRIAERVFGTQSPAPASVPATAPAGTKPAGAEPAPLREVPSPK